MRNQLLFTTTLILLGNLVMGQCNLLSTTITKDFSADGICAPVNVDKFEITYSFNVAQNPANIEIEFRWNDPANTVQTVSGTDLIISNGNRTFQAIANPFLYPDTGPECFFEAQTFIIVSNDECETSEQSQIIPSWNQDDENGGVIAFDPGTFDVCQNTGVSGAVFDDASTFNCNIVDNPDNPNQISRWTQFVYGTDPIPGVGRIRDVTLVDIGTVVLSDNGGNIDNPQTRGTPGLLITAGHFGPVEEVPSPADGPIHNSFPISFPANAANVVGSTFQITLYNWNICNPFNNDQADPNYEDAVSEVLNITIVAPPNPSYQARLGNAAGTIGTLFCIETDIYFENLTLGGPYNYEWEFYNGSTPGTGINTTTNATSPTIQYTTGGDKLVRLIASDPNVQGVCEVIYDAIITISPDAVAEFDFSDPTFTNIIDPDFCQSGSDVFTVGFIDNTILVPDTELRFEFYNQGNSPTSGVPDQTEPSDGSFLTTNVPSFTKNFSNEEYVVVLLQATNSSTGCSSTKQDTVFVYGRSQPQFVSDSVCEGNRTSFTGIPDKIASLTTQVNDDEVNLYEWDFSYDGTFNVERSAADNTDFEWYLDGTNIATNTEPSTSSDGTYTVALRMTTEKGMCSDLFTDQVIIHQNPDAQLAYDVVGAICPDEPVLFTNNSTNTSPTVYQLEISHSFTGYLVQVDFNTADTLIITPNPDDTTRIYRSVMIAESDEGCITESNELFFRVNPDEKVGFSDLNFNPTGSNCSEWNSTLVVNQATQNLNPDSFVWSIYDGATLLAGFPVTKNSGDADFNSLDYTITNSENTNTNYLAILEASKSGLCITSDTIVIQISPQADASFTYLRVEDCNEVVFELDATSKGLSNYDWTFDPTPDFIAGSDDEMIIGYNRELVTGNDFNAEITLVTTNLVGCDSEPVMQTDLIEKQRLDIIVDFTLSTDTLQLPDNTVAITNNSSNGAGFIYEWDFGDGQTSTDRDPVSHSYDRFGSYEINLKVTDDFCFEEDFKRIVVLPADPILEFEGDTLEGCAPLTVQFTNLSQYAQDGEYLWEFGDGSISRADNPTHTFFQDGNFSVRLRGKNEVGEIFETEKVDYISVYQRPFADFLASPRVVFIPDQEAYFKNLSENATSFFWDFGDGSTSTEFEPKHAYTEEGEYDITLIATNPLGCVDTLFRAAEIKAVSGGRTASPNAFTPNLNGPTGGDVGNGSNPDNINDVFIPFVEGVTKFRMQIYNKWGELLFESNSQNVGWDGYYKGRLAPSGVYVYRLELRYSDGQDVIKVGDVTLIQ